MIRKLLYIQLHKRLLLLIATILVLSQTLFAQGTYITNGSATSNGSGCFTLTTASPTSQSGSVWYQNLLSLKQDFDFTFKVNLGANAGGADGIAFVLQPVNTAQGGNGNSLGYGGITPSLDIEYDTYTNFDRTRDPSYDHIAVQANGNPSHATFDAGSFGYQTNGTLAGPVYASPTTSNIKDGQDHISRIVWSATAQTLSVYFDGSLRLNYTSDIVSNIFGGNQNVYWGFTGATGGLTNLQKFCVVATAFQQTVTSAPLTIDITKTNVSCFAGNNGSATASFTGGTPPYTFLNWSNGATTTSISNLAVGTYFATVRDASGRINSDTINITGPPAISPTITASGLTTFCQGGSVTLTSSSAARNNLKFNGNNYLEAANNPAINLTNSLSLEAWVKMSDVSGVNYIVSKGTDDQAEGQYGLLLIDNLNGTAKAQFHFFKNIQVAVESFTAFSAGQWYHLAGTWDGGIARLYVNGVLDNQVAFAGPLIANTGPLQIGRLGKTSCGCTYNFKGEIAEVRIWNAARTATEIQVNKNLNVSTNNPGLAAYYKMDEGSGSVTADAANGNTANLIQNPLWNSSSAPINYSSYLWSPVGATTSAINATATGSYTVTVTDANGCAATSAATDVTVNSLPIATASNNGPIFSGSAINLTSTGTVTYSWTGPNGFASTLQNPTIASSTTAMAGTYTVTVSDNGCTAVASTNVVIYPAVVTKNITVSLNSSGTASIVASDVYGGAETGVSMTVNKTTFTCSDISASPVAVTLTLTDSTGVASSNIAYVTVLDQIKPIIPVLPDITGECSATATAPTTTDNCAGTFAGTTTDALTYTSQGTHVITWTFDDGHGNIATSTQNVIVKDNTKPDVPVLPDVTAECSAIVTPPATTDNCAGTITGTTTDSTSFTTQGTRTITWSFNDGNGNTSTATQKVIIKDNTKPVITVLADVNGECSATATAPTTTDNCTGTITGTTTAPLTYSTQGTHIITWTFNDGNGNTSTVNQNVIVKDISIPVVPVLFNISGECSATATIPSATDNCSGVIAGTTTDSLTYTTQGIHVITWRFDDRNGNIATATQNVIVNDVTLPTIIPPANITVNNDPGSNTAIISIGTPATSDNCQVISVVNNHPSSVYPLGTTLVTWTVTDINNNTRTASQSITVNDNEPPVISCAPPVLKANGLNQCGAIVNYSLPFANDNGSTNSTTISAGCSDGILIFDIPASNNVSSLNFNTSGAFADIAHGHGQNNTITVELLDGNGSWVPVKTIQTGNGDYHFGGTSISFATIPQVTKIKFTSTETVHCAFHFYLLQVKLNSSIITQTNGLPPGSLFPVGTTTNTFAATDASGNIATCSFNVTINDTQKPVINGIPANITIANGTDSCRAKASWPAVTVTDNCTGATIISDHQSGELFPVGVTTVTYTATDAHSNSNSVQFTVTVSDTQKPSITPPANITVNNTAGLPTATVNLGTPVSGDNCKVDYVVSDHPSSTYPIGATKVTWTVKDIHGNSNTAIQTITVIDNEKPVIIGMPLDIVQTNDASICGAIVRWTPPTTKDNSSVVTRLSSDYQPGAVFLPGITTVTYTATDINGNVMSGSFTITVTDNEAPRVNTRPVTVTLVNGSANINLSDVNDNSTDNCGIKTLTLSKATFDCTNIGTNIVTLTVTDIHDNTSSSPAIVTVSGEVPTSFIIPIPANNINTGGVPINIYLGYGPQSITLKDSVVSSTAVKYLWTGNGSLNCNACSSPVFAPTIAGSYTFSCTAINAYGCTTVSSITICVRDIRVPGSNGTQVYVCHLANNQPPQTIPVAVTSVNAYLTRNTADKLGSCDMQPCAATPLISTTALRTASEEVVMNNLEEINPAGLTVKISPNPTANTFTFIIRSNKSTPVSIRILNELGQSADALLNVPLGVPVILGGKLISGSYYAEVIQEKERKIVKLVKASQ